MTTQLDCLRCAEKLMDACADGKLACGWMCAGRLLLTGTPGWRMVVSEGARVVWRHRMGMLHFAGQLRKRCDTGHRKIPRWL